MMDDDYKPLTDKQVRTACDETYDSTQTDWPIKFARAIEQAAIENYLAQQSQAPDVPNSWREEFSRRVYANLAAADNQDIPLEDYPERILAVMDGMRIVPIPLAFESLKAAMHDDPSYAWSWHCNLAMPIMDAIGCTHRQANDAAARLMRHLFDFDVTKCREWEQIAAPTPPAPQDAQAGKDALTSEQRHALKEGERNAVTEKYFRARAWVNDTSANRRTFEAGFDRGYDAAIAAAKGQA